MDMKTAKEQKPKILIYGIERLGYHQLKDIKNSSSFIIHPAFRNALECTT